LNQMDIAELVSAAIGLKITPEELLMIGERIHNLERVFNIIHAKFTREDDYPPERFFKEPIKSGPYKGEKLDKERFDEMLDENYQLHGWDKRGIPKKSTLKYLGLEYLIKDLENAGISCEE
ncbi:MAG: aldehyde ferredoxin oxidoreductase C-terminal domain-containing protein, partial [Candidatus Bathyarchaeia archaeon]